MEIKKEFNKEKFLELIRNAKAKHAEQEAEKKAKQAEAFKKLVEQLKQKAAEAKEENK